MKVNGNERAVPAEGTVLSLLKELGHDPQRVAVEKNGAIIPRAQFAEEKLTDADHLEVVCFVGGGYPSHQTTVWCEGDILRKTRICPKEICAPRAAHTFFTGMKTEIQTPGFHRNCNAISFRLNARCA